MDGVLLVDKPIGVSSHKIVSILRKTLNMKKIGHAGTLDPQASGLLILCIGKGTKISQYLMDSNKVYQFEAVMGKVTTTFDNEGDVTVEKEVRIDQEDILDQLSQFDGWIDQLPPMYSAIKKDGKKLYEYARANEKVELTPRKVCVNQIKLLSWQKPIASLEVHCSKGTYVRSIANDLGQLLGCGAFAQKIRRLKSGMFDVGNALSIEDIQSKDKVEQGLIEIFDALSESFIKVDVTLEQEQHIRHGKSLALLNFLDVPKGMVLFHRGKKSIAMAENLGENSFKLRRVI